MVRETFYTISELCWEGFDVFWDGSGMVSFNCLILMVAGGGGCGRGDAGSWFVVVLVVFPQPHTCRTQVL